MPTDTIFLGDVPGISNGTKPPCGGCAKILVVEDCEAVAKIIQLVLGSIGHDVRTASDGDEAVAMFESEGPFELLLTDVLLPGSFCGYELAEVLWLKQPSLPVIFVTGYPLETVARENGFSESVQHLVKPAMISEIRGAVLEALRAGAGGIGSDYD